MKITANAMFARVVALMEAEIGDEIVALDVERGMCFGFSPVAASVWRLLAQPRSFEEIRSALLSEYDVDAELCAQEVREFLEQTIADGLTLIISPHAVGGAPWQSPQRKAVGVQ